MQTLSALDDSLSRRRTKLQLQMASEWKLLQTSEETDQIKEMKISREWWAMVQNKAKYQISKGTW